MAIDLAKKLPNLMALKVSRSVLISGILSFLYVVEICIGYRTVYFLFKTWITPQSQFPTTVTWIPWLGSLILALSSTITINTISAIWEKRQLDQEEQPRNITRFALHVLVGGILWRYISLWWSEKKDLQKRGALMLTILKFLFTQIFTIPMVIIHVCYLESFEEMSFVMASVMCISLTVILTCVIFSWCATEVEALPTLKFENLNLVPILFKQDEVLQPPKNDNQQEVVDLATNQQENEKSTKHEVKDGIILFLVWIQTSGFSFGRLLALGILLKLAGVYAISIMVLQFLASVIYLKFQTPLVVSDTLTKRKQLTRLAFLSYTLIFEWHLHRSHKTGYNFSANVKHSLFYYCITISESIFYIVAWVITSSSATNTTFDLQSEERITFISNVAIVGSLSLITSLFIHVFLILFKSERLRIFCNTVKRNIEIRNLGNSLRKTETQAKRRSKIEISSPYHFVVGKGNPNFETTSENMLSSSNLERQTSYRDLKEPIDEEIEIYVRRGESSGKDNEEIEHAELGKTSCKESPWVNVTLTEDAKLQCAANSGNKIGGIKLPNILLSRVLRLKGSLLKTTSVTETENDVKQNSLQQVNDHQTNCDNVSTSEMKSDDKVSKESSSEGIERNKGGKRDTIVNFSNSVIKQFDKFVEMTRSISGDFQPRIPRMKKTDKDVNDDPIKSLGPTTEPTLSQKAQISTSESKDVEHVQSYKNKSNLTNSSSEVLIGNNAQLKNIRDKLPSDSYTKRKNHEAFKNSSDYNFERAEAKVDNVSDEIDSPYGKHRAAYDISTHEYVHSNDNNLHGGNSGTENEDFESNAIGTNGSFRSRNEVNVKDQFFRDCKENASNNDSRDETELIDAKNRVNDSKIELDDYKNELDYPRNEPGYSKDEQNDSKKEPDYSKNETECSKNELNYSKNDMDYSKNDMDYSKNELDYPKNESNYPNNEPNYFKDEQSDSKNEPDYSKNKAHFYKNELNYSKYELNYPKNEHDYFKDEQSDSKNEPDYSKGETDCSKNDLDHSKNELNYSKSELGDYENELHESEDEGDYFQNERDYSNNELNDPKNDINCSDELVLDDIEVSNDNTECHDRSSCPCHTCRCHRIRFRVSMSENKNFDGQSESYQLTCDSTSCHSSDVKDCTEKDVGKDLAKPSLTPRKIKVSNQTAFKINQNVEQFV